jgi:hypothetical protein
MEKYRLELLGLSEVKKKGSGEKRLEKGFILRYSGVPAINRAKEGVGVIVSDELQKSHQLEPSQFKNNNS